MNKILSLAMLPCAALAGNVSISAIAGYGLPIPGAYLGSNTTNNTVTGKETFEAVTGSFADGVRIGGEFGYSVNDQIAFALGIRYEASSEYEFTEDNTSSTGTSNYSETRSVSGIAFIPSVVYTLPGEVYRPYARMNVHVGMPTEIIKSSSIYSTGTLPTEYESESEKTGGIAWGFGGGLGVEYIMSPTLSVVAEVVAESWTWAPEELKVKKYTRDGEDLLEEMDEVYKETKYVESYTTDGEDDPDSPAKALLQPETNAAIGLNLGLKFRF